MVQRKTLSDGDRVTFTTQFEEYATRNGRSCEVVRELASETARMYRIRFEDGYEIAAYEYELQTADE